MRTRIAAAVVFVIFVASAAARADGLIVKLPEDGTWGVYKAEGYKERGDKTKEQVNGWLRISSVGKTTESNEPCRWIEIENSYKTNVGDRRSTDKLLIPEKYLTAGEAPAEHILRGWFQFDHLPAEGKPAPVACKLGEPQCAGRKGSHVVKLQNGSQTAVVSCNFEARLHSDAPFGVVWYQHSVIAPDGRESMMKFVLDDFGPTARSRLPKQQ